MKGGMGAWKGLHDLQRGRAGLHPVKTRATYKRQQRKFVCGEDRESVPLAGVF